MINNFKQLKKHLVFDTLDDFYHIQIFKRKKDDGNEYMTSNNVVISVYTVKSLEQLDKIERDVVNICNSTNGRAYLNLNKKSFKRTALEMLKDIATKVSIEDYLGVNRSFQSSVGKFNSPTNNKKWLIDVDDTEWYEQNKETLFSFISKLQPVRDKVIDVVPTPNGFHVITTPFNLKDFNQSEVFSELDVHKNNPTILYCK